MSTTPPPLGTSDTYAILSCVLIVFFLLAVIPLIIKTSRESKESLGGSSLGSRYLSAIMRPSEDFLAARNSANALTIAMSFFASGMGAWVVYGTAELGALPSISWWGVIGYSFASACPAVVIAFLGPVIRRRTAAGFSTADFALQRYGRVAQVFVAAVSCFYMYIYLVSEFTVVGNVYGLAAGDGSNKYTNSVLVPVAVVTIVYTSIAGLPASILTDKFQGALVLLLLAVVSIAAFAMPENKVTPSEFAKASKSTWAGVQAAVSLFIAILAAELFNQSTWQRVWAAKSTRDLRLGFIGGALLVAPVMMLFGVLGMVAYANDPDSYESFTKLAYLSFFDIISPLNQAWYVIVLILVTALCASSVDSLQNGLAAVLSKDLMANKLSINWSRIIVIAFNIPAIIQALEKYDVIQLFLVADLVCAFAAPALFLGLIEPYPKDAEGETAASSDGKFVRFLRTYLPPTELGMMLGAISGFSAVFVLGEIYDVGDAINPYTNKVYARKPWSAFWLVNGADCALCGTQTMVTFIVVPLVSAVATVLFSLLHIHVLCGGDVHRAIEPIIPRDLWGLLTEDEGSEEANETVEGKSSDDAGSIEEALELGSKTMGRA